MKKVFIITIFALLLISLSTVSFAMSYSDSTNTYSGSGTYYSDYDYGTYYSDYDYGTYYSDYGYNDYYDFSYSYNPYSYSYSDYSYYDYYDGYSSYDCSYYNSCYSTYSCYNNNCNYPPYTPPTNYPPTTNPGYPPQQSYTPPNNLVYGGPTPYVDPIPPLNIRTFSCKDPEGYDGELKTFGVGTQSEFRCTQGIWVFIRQVPFVVTSPPQQPTQNKLDFYGGLRETPVQQNQPPQNQPPLIYASPPSYSQPVAVHCVNPTGLQGEIRYFGIVNPQPFICINGQWILDP